MSCCVHGCEQNWFCRFRLHCPPYWGDRKDGQQLRHLGFAILVHRSACLSNRVFVHPRCLLFVPGIDYPQDLIVFPVTSAGWGHRSSAGRMPDRLADADVGFDCLLVESRRDEAVRSLTTMTC